MKNYAEEHPPKKFKNAEGKIDTFYSPALCQIFKNLTWKKGWIGFNALCERFPDITPAALKTILLAFAANKFVDGEVTSVHFDLQFVERITQHIQALSINKPPPDWEPYNRLPTFNTQRQAPIEQEACRLIKTNPSECARNYLQKNGKSMQLMRFVSPSLAAMIKTLSQQSEIPNDWIPVGSRVVLNTATIMFVDIQLKLMDNRKHETQRRDLNGFRFISPQAFQRIKDLQAQFIQHNNDWCNADEIASRFGILQEHFIREVRRLIDSGKLAQSETKLTLVKGISMPVYSPQAIRTVYQSLR